MIICLVSIVWSALKNVNDEAVNGKKDEGQDIANLKIKSILITVIGWLLSTIAFATNLNMVN